MKKEIQWKLIDSYKRKKFIKIEISKLIFKALLKNKSITYVQKQFILYRLSKISGIKTRNRINNRCIVSGRNYNILNKFNYSRFILRKQGYLGHISGLQKH